VPVPRRRVVVLASAAVLLALGAVVALVLVGVTQTAYGRDVIRGVIEDQLASRVQGSLHVGRIHGSLLTGVRIDSLEIRGTDDSVFVASGPITVEYDPRDLLDRRLLLRHLHVERPVVHLRRYEDGVWNFRRIFPPGPPRARRSTGRGFGDFVVVDSATVRDGRFLLTMPWHPADSLRGAARDSAIAHNLARDDAEIVRAADDTAHEGADAGREAYARTRRWTNIDWASNGVRLADPDSTGRRFGIARLDVIESDPPFRARNIRGSVLLHGDSLWLDVPHFDLPGSTGSAEGVIAWDGGPVRYDIRVRGDSVSLADVAWVYPTLPRDGGGTMRLHIRTDTADARIVDYALADMDVRTTRSRLVGDMTFGVGGPVLRVTDVDMRADPVDFDLLRTLAGGPFPYDWQGTLTGTVRGAGGPVNRFRVDTAALVFRDANVPGAVSRASGRGELDVLDPAFAAFRGFRVDVATLDLRTLQFVNPDFPRLGGTVAGVATLDSVWTDVRFRDASLAHVDAGPEPSRVTGSGRVTMEDDFIRYDVDLVAQPLSFGTLARSYPGVPIRGAYAGPLRLRGTLADLVVQTSLAGPGGRLSVDGRFDLFGPEYAATGSASALGLDLSALLERLDVPPTSLTGIASYDVAGASAATLAGGFTLDLDRSLVDSVRVEPSTLALTFGGGRATLDSLRLATSAATLIGSGGLGLVAEQADSVQFELRVDSLGGLRRYLAAAADDSLLGALTVRGIASGSTEGVRVAGTVEGDRLVAGALRAGRVYGGFTLDDVLGAVRGPVRLALDSGAVGRVRLDDATLEADVRGRADARLRLRAESDAGPSVVAAGGLHADSLATRFTLDSADVVLGADTWSLVRPATLLVDRAGIALDTVALRGAGGQVLAAGALPVVDPLRFAVRAEGLPLRAAGQLAGVATPLAGRAAFSVDVAGTRAAPLIGMRGELGGARIGDVRLARLTLAGDYAAERLRLALALARGDTLLLQARADVPVDLAMLPREERLLDAPLTGNVRSERVELAVAEEFTEAVRDADGTFTLNLDLGGTVRQPTVRGALRVEDGAMTLAQAGVRLRTLEADVGFEGDSVAVRRVFAATERSRPGTLTLAGGIGLDDLDDPTFDLALTARDFHAVALPRLADLEVTTTPNLRLEGRLAASTLTGGVRVERGTIYFPEFTSKQVIDLDDPEFASLVDTSAFGDRSLLPNAPPALLRGMSLRNVAIAMGDEVWLRGPEANINLGGQVNVTTAPAPRGRGGETALALDGVLAANRGTYRLNLGVVQRTFVIERGTLRFFGEPELNPTLDIAAVHTVRQFDRQAARQDVEVRAVIGGTLARPELRLSGAFAGENRVALSESDAVSYLVTGAPSFALGADQSSELTAARLALSSLGSYLGDRAAGGLFDVVQVQTSGLLQGDTDNLRSAGAGILAGTRLGVGKQLSDRVFVTANAGLCQLGNVVGGQAFNAADFAESIGVKVDYRLGGGLSLSAGVEPPTSQLFCSRQINARGFAPTPRQWAFDLFRTWRF